MLLALGMVYALSSPMGQPFDVPEAEQLLANWSTRKNLRTYNVRVLVGQKTGSKKRNAKAHEKGWSRREDMIWLRHDTTGDYMHSVGATYGRDAGLHFHAYLASNQSCVTSSPEEWKSVFLGEVADVSGWRLADPPANASQLVGRIFVGKQANVSCTGLWASGSPMGRAGQGCFVRPDQLRSRRPAARAPS